MKNEKTYLNIRKVKRQVKGITLIALVVTIIVLLILAGVAISLTIGSNGIFTRAGDATEKYEQASRNEEEEMKKAENLIDDYLNGKGGSQGGGDDQKDEVIVDTVKIPKGFYYVGGTKNDGLIISDNEADKNKYSKENWEDQANIPSGLEKEIGAIEGNQFVWVPVEDSYEFKTYCGYYNGSYDDSYFSSYSEPYTNAEEWETKAYNKMKSSVETNNGFYVARFEASEGEGSKAESKPGVEPWRYIKWGDSMTEIGTEGAVYRAQNMYTDKNNYAVTSTLIYGVQWDAIMNWLDPKYSTATKENPCDANSIVVKSEKGNHSGDVADCGAYEDDRLKNIYDLCGNLCEWTMEAYSTSNRVIRGGNFVASGSKYPVSFRSYTYPDDDGNGYFGIRTALYL